MWQVNCNYKRNDTGTKCPLCKKSEDTKKAESEKAEEFLLRKENNKREWEEMIEIYRKNKKKREVAVVKVQDQNKIIKENKKRTKYEKQKRKKNV